MLDCLTPLQVRGGATAHGEFDDLVRVLEVELPRKWRAGLILRASPSFVEGNRRVFALNIGMRNLPNLPLDQLCPKCNAKVGENCKTNDGTALRGVHSERWPKKYPQRQDVHYPAIRKAEQFQRR